MIDAEVEPTSHCVQNRQSGATLVGMLKKALYVAAFVILVVGFLYAAIVDPSPCRMDDASAFCGSGTRWSAVVGSALLAWVLSYIARGVDNRKS